MTDVTSEKPVKQLRGLALVPPEQRKEIARQGAYAIHKKGLAYEWNAEKARLASLKGWGKIIEITKIVELKEDSENEEIA